MAEFPALGDYDMAKSTAQALEDSCPCGLWAAVPLGRLGPAVGNATRDGCFFFSSFMHVLLGEIG